MEERRRVEGRVENGKEEVKNKKETYVVEEVDIFCNLLVG
jgi:hypothetical protein